MRRILPVLLAAAAGCPANGSSGRDAASGSGAPPATPTAAASPPAPEPGAVELTEDMGSSYFAAGPAAQAAARFALEDWGAARRGFAAALKKEKDAAARAPHPDGRPV